MARGEMVGAIAMTVPAAGSDLQGIRCSAQKVEGGYSVSGQKTFITNGQMADLVIVVVKTNPEAGSKGTSLLLVEAASTGFQKGQDLGVECAGGGVARHQLLEPYPGQRGGASGGGERGGQKRHHRRRLRRCHCLRAAQLLSAFNGIRHCSRCRCIDPDHHTGSGVLNTNRNRLFTTVYCQKKKSIAHKAQSLLLFKHQ